MMSRFEISITQFMFFNLNSFLTQVPGCRETSTRNRKGGRRRSRSQAPAPASSSSSEDSVSNASVASVASARELRLPDLELQVCRFDGAKVLMTLYKASFAH